MYYGYDRVLEWRIRMHRGHERVRARRSNLAGVANCREETPEANLEGSGREGCIRADAAVCWLVDRADPKIG